MFSRFFVRRPVFASGDRHSDYARRDTGDPHAAGCAVPDVAPPSIKISATYTGARADAGKQRDAGDEQPLTGAG